MNKHKRLPFPIVLNLGIKIISVLKSIHDKGLVHRDIKPHNILFSDMNLNKQINLIDFGFCKPYIDNITGKHISIKKNHGMIGSKNYASIMSHNHSELSRRDDLESLGYMLIYFYLGSLSWQDNSELSNDKIKYLKSQIDINDLPDILINYMKYVKNLDFFEKPNYNLIIDSYKKEIEILTKQI